MNFSNVKLLFAREIRDQLRDRRTLFMMFVLPILLYPLLGMLFVEIQQFVQEKPTSVLVVGANRLSGLPPLFENESFCETLFTLPKQARLLEVHFARSEPLGVPGQRQTPAAALEQLAAIRQAAREGGYDAALFFPATFAEELEKFRDTLERRTAPPAETAEGALADPGLAALTVPSPEMIPATANEKSKLACQRLDEVLHAWREVVGKNILAAGGVPASAARPFDPKLVPLPDQTAYPGAAMWSRILPVLMLLWALTGAFYPAVDLCAGEKERGTLETLLCSPAERSEIVLGKLATIMVFSVVTAVLNLLSVGVTGWLIFGGQLGFGAPPPMAMLWMVVALIPVAALFSALCLALAAFARSTKEGQYYLMPLLLITMPLAVLPMAPSVELGLGNSLIPISGVVILLRSVLEGDYWRALQFLPIVVAVTLAACLLSIRWAVDQFNSESVLFRESERLDVGLWMRHLRRDRQATPTAAQAVFCGALILVVRFFAGAAMRPPASFGGFAWVTLMTQLVVIAAPALLLTIFLTASPRDTLLLRRPRWLTIPAAAALAVFLHPAVIWLHGAVQQLYPISGEVMDALKTVDAMFAGAPLWQVLLLLAVLPGVCEELAFRGFILSGFRRLGHKWRAIVYSAIFFGVAHTILQQSLMACLVGVVLALLAVQTGSLLPGIVFHVIHNILPLAVSRLAPEGAGRFAMLDRLMTPAEGGGYVYSWPLIVAGLFAALLLLIWFTRLPYEKSPEEKLQDAIDRGLHTDDETPMMQESAEDGGLAPWRQLS